MAPPNQNTILKRKTPTGYETISSQVPFRIPIEVEGLVSQAKTISPTVNDPQHNPRVGFTVYPDTGFDVLSRVAFTGEPNLIPANIRKDVFVFGVKGTAEGGSEPSGLYQDKSVNPTNEIQIITADTGWDALGSVTVNSVTASEPNLKPENIVEGVTIFDITGEAKVSGNLQEKTVNPTTSSQEITADKPEYDALSKVTVNAILTETKTIVPSFSSQTVLPSSGKYIHRIDVNAVTSAIDSNIQPGNIKDGITILGVEGNYSGESPVLQSKSVISSTDSFPISTDSGYDGMSIVTLSGTNNTLIPGNIKKNVTIFGVTGTYEGSSSDPSIIYNSGTWFDNFEQILLSNSDLSSVNFSSAFFTVYGSTGSTKEMFVISPKVSVEGYTKLYVSDGQSSGYLFGSFSIFMTLDLDYSAMRSTTNVASLFHSVTYTIPSSIKDAGSGYIVIRAEDTNADNSYRSIALIQLQN